MMIFTCYVHQYTKIELGLYWHWTSVVKATLHNGLLIWTMAKGEFKKKEKKEGKILLFEKV